MPDKKNIKINLLTIYIQWLLIERFNMT